MFDGCQMLKEIKGINNFNTINVINMRGMIGECSKLEYLDLSNFNTANVMDMENMFSKCRELKEIKGINNFNTGNVKNMLGMFEECNKLKSLDLSNFNTINVTDMYKMFSGCFELEYLDLSNFDLSKVINIGYMFYKCYKLKEIKGISNLNYNNVSNKEGIFEDCVNLTQLNKEENQKNELNVEKISLTLNFISVDQQIKCSISSYNTDVFLNIEEKLYLQFPLLKHKNIFFLYNGNIIKKSFTLEKNNIENGSFILIAYEE